MNTFLEIVEAKKGQDEARVPGQSTLKYTAGQYLDFANHQKAEADKHNPQSPKWHTHMFGHHNAMEAHHLKSLGGVENQASKQAQYHRKQAKDHGEKADKHWLQSTMLLEPENRRTWTTKSGDDAAYYQNAANFHLAEANKHQPDTESYHQHMALHHMHMGDLAASNGDVDTEAKHRNEENNHLDTASRYASGADNVVASDTMKRPTHPGENAPYSALAEFHDAMSDWHKHKEWSLRNKNRDTKANRERRLAEHHFNLATEYGRK